METLLSMNKHTWTCWIDIYIYMYFSISTSNIIYTYKLSKNQLNTTCCSVGFRIFLETTHLSPHEQCSKRNSNMETIEPKKSYSAHSKLNLSFYAYTSFSNTKVLSFKCEAYIIYIMYSNEILSWVLFFHWFFPFFFNSCGTGKTSKLLTSSCVVALLSPSFLQVTSCQPINGKNCFFLANLPKGRMTKIRKRKWTTFYCRRFFWKNRQLNINNLLWIPNFQTFGFCCGTGPPFWEHLFDPCFGIPNRPNIWEERPKLPSPLHLRYPGSIFVSVNSSELSWSILIANWFQHPKKNRGPTNLNML